MFYKMESDALNAEFFKARSHCFVVIHITKYG